MSGEGVTAAVRDFHAHPAPIVTIDDESEPGSWADAIAHTPRLAAQMAAEQDPSVDD